MSNTKSNQRLKLGSKIPNFTLQSANNFGQFTLNNINSHGLIVAFICNHCPFVKHIADEFSNLAKRYKKHEIETIAISSNDVNNYPDDSPKKMLEESKNRNYIFPYLYDVKQDVAKLFGATCTPDFFLLDDKKNLFYHGQFDSSRPSNDICATGEDLSNNIDLLLNGDKPNPIQFPSIGCNIKWILGNEPDYFIKK